MPLRIVRNDIVKMDTEAIVNTANDYPEVGSGCDSAVFKAAGYDELLAYRREKIGFVPEGEAFITPGFNLKAKYIIHAVSPLYQGGDAGEEEKLRSCYRKSLQLAKKYNIRSIAFPLISTGGFGYPKEEGLRIAVDEINAFLLENEMDIFLVVFGDKAVYLAGKIYPGLEEYIDRNYVETKQQEEYGSDFYGSDPYRSNAYKSDAYKSDADESGPYGNKRTEGLFHGIFRRKKKEELPDKDRQAIETGPEEALIKPLAPMQKPSAPVQKPSAMPRPSSALKKPSSGMQKPSALQELSSGMQKPSTVRDDRQVFAEEPYIDFESEHESRLQERMRHLSDTFSQYLIYLIQEKNMSNAEVYKRAIVDKKIFSKIKNNANYHPQKLTAMCLCVGAMLNLDETRDLLARAGYALSPCDKTDIIFAYFIENKIYDMIELDIQLEEHGLPCIIS